jgi:hypothetical protein
MGDYSVELMSIDIGFTLMIHSESQGSAAWNVPVCVWHRGLVRSKAGWTEACQSWRHCQPLERSRWFCRVLDDYISPETKKAETSVSTFRITGASLRTPI